MSASSIPFYKPKWAVTAWADDANVYIEIPGNDGVPYIARFDLTRDGLGKALTSMRALYSRDKTGTVITQREVKRKGKAKPVTDPERRSKVRDILRRRGVI